MGLGPRRFSHGITHRDPELARFVTERSQETWSSQQIAGHLKSTRQLQAYACHEIIYRYVYGPDGRAAELHKLLPRMRRRRRARAMHDGRAACIFRCRTPSHSAPDRRDVRLQAKGRMSGIGRRPDFWSRPIADVARGRCGRPRLCVGAANQSRLANH